MAVGNTLGPLLGACLLLRCCPSARSLGRLRDVGGLLLFGGLLGTSLSAALGALVLRFTGVNAWAGFATSFLVWWSGDCMGVLLVAPLLLTASTVRDWRRALELLAIAGLGALSCFVLFNPYGLGARQEVLAFSVFPFVIWAAIRIGVFGSALTTLGISATAVWETAHRMGPFVHSDALHNAALLQVFLAVMSVTGTLLAAVITEREQLVADHAARAAIEESERLYRGIVATTTEGVWMLNSEFRTVFVNAQLAAMLGYSPDEMLSRHVTEFLFPEDVERKYSVLERRRRGVSEQFDDRYRRKDGSELWAHLSAAPLLDENGHFKGALSMVTDMTEYRRTEQALRESEKLAVTGRLAATIAHEINNPLEAITNLLYLAQRSSSPEAVQSFLATAMNEVERVGSIARHTLGFYRDSSAPRRFDLAELSLDVLALYHHRLDAKGIKVWEEIRPAVDIYGSAGELKQVIGNLLLNAIEAVPLAGAVRFRVRRVGSYAHLVIADNGGGIPVEHKAQLFRPFFTTGKEFGTGLGLWVSKGLVEKHGGRIRAYSSSQPGRSGTILSISLPLATDQSQAVAA
jgi:PAS domain S-box-containing protein